jgi:hypothetical protein
MAYTSENLEQSYGAIVQNLTLLISKIQELSPEGQDNLAYYVEFLLWQESERRASHTQGWSFSFIESFNQATVAATDKPDGMEVAMALASVGAEARPALWAHPPLSGQTTIEYYVPVPKKVRNIRLRVAVGIRDGAQISDTDLVAFSIKINGLRVWGVQTNRQEWQVAEIPLSINSGDMVRVMFNTESLGSHQYNWAVWGDPQLVGQTNG